MTAAIPPGAQRSPDGYYWWDGMQWRPVHQDGSDGGPGQGAQTAAFVLDDATLRVDVDDQDNPSGHVTPHSDAGTKVNFSVLNVGTGSGAATVVISVDQQHVQTWTSADIPPRGVGSPDGGYLHGCGRHASGPHAFAATVTPGATQGNVEARNDNFNVE